VELPQPRHLLHSPGCWGQVVVLEVLTGRVHEARADRARTPVAAGAHTCVALGLLRPPVLVGPPSDLGPMCACVCCCLADQGSPMSGSLVAVAACATLTVVVAIALIAASTMHRLKRRKMKAEREGNPGRAAAAAKAEALESISSLLCLSFNDIQVCLPQAPQGGLRQRLGWEG